MSIGISPTLPQLSEHNSTPHFCIRERYIERQSSSAQLSEVTVPLVYECPKNNPVLVPTENPVIWKLFERKRNQSAHASRRAFFFRNTATLVRSPAARPSIPESSPPPIIHSTLTSIFFPSSSHPTRPHTTETPPNNTASGTQSPDPYSSTIPVSPFATPPPHLFPGSSLRKTYP